MSDLHLFGLIVSGFYVIILFTTDRERLRELSGTQDLILSLSFPVFAFCLYKAIF